MLLDTWGGFCKPLKYKIYSKETKKSPFPIPIPIVIVIPVPLIVAVVVPSLFPIPSSSLWSLHPCSLFPCCLFAPHILVPHSLLIPLPLTSLFLIPSSSLCPSRPCSPFPHSWQLAPVIHPASSGLQGWGQVLGCSPLWYCGRSLTPAAHHPIIHPTSSSSQQWPGWAWGCHLGAVLL